MVTTLITVAAIAWLTQLAFGGWQIRRFNRALIALPAGPRWRRPFLRAL
ncbi:glucitol operon activator protein [Klebsiella aerogenes]|nr:glucitol operon activator protein [Klebsiella aerogenes]